MPEHPPIGKPLCVDVHEHDVVDIRGTVVSVLAGGRAFYVEINGGQVVLVKAEDIQKKS